MSVKMSVKDKIAFGALSVVAGATAVKLLRGTWVRLTGQEPPDPNDPAVPAGTALVWAAVSGALLACGQILVNRFGAKQWQAKAKPVVVHISEG